MSDHSCERCGGNLAGGEDRPCTCKRKRGPGWMADAARTAAAIKACGRQAVCTGCGASLGNPNSVCSCQPAWPGVEVKPNPRTDHVAVGQLSVRGRLRKPVATITVSGNEASVRVDDDANAEFWCEVRLTREQLMWALGKMG